MDIEQARTNMITQQFRTWGVVNQAILTLFHLVKRETFVPVAYKSLAFADMAIPLGHGQYMLNPRDEAKILDALNIQPNERVLEIGTGSAYFTALLAHLAKYVESVDIFSDFTESALQKLSASNLRNVMLHTADAALGYKKNTQYDVIVITGSLPVLPKNFFQQINITGRLFAITGQSPTMEAVLFTRTDHDQWQKNVLFETDVLPLLNAVYPSAFVF